jgi:hypothetical protein
MAQDRRVPRAADEFATLVALAWSVFRGTSASYRSGEI